MQRKATKKAGAKQPVVASPERTVPPETIPWALEPIISQPKISQDGSNINSVHRRTTKGIGELRTSSGSNRGTDSNRAVENVSLGNSVHNDAKEQNQLKNGNNDRIRKNQHRTSKIGNNVTFSEGHSITGGDTKISTNKGNGQANDGGQKAVADGRRALSKTPVKLTFPFAAPSLAADERFSNQKRLLLNCDWLSFRCVDGLKVDDFKDGIYIAEYLNAKYTFELLPGRAAMYNNKCNVYLNWSNEQIKIGLITFNSSNEIHKGTMVFKVENWLLYDDCFRLCVKDITSNLLAALKVDVINISRFDIAVDGVNLHGLMAGLVNDSRYMHFGKRTISRKTVDPYTDELEGFQVGKREGKKYAIYYNKSREIRDKSKKDYISEYWKENGFDITEDVWRFELTLHSEAINEIEGIDIKDVSSLLERDFLVGAFELHIKRFFEFVHASTLKNASQRTKVRVFDFDSSEHQRFAKVKKRVSESHRTTKIMVKRLVVSAAFEKRLSLRTHYLKVAARYVFENDLSEWLTKRQLFIADDIRKAAKLNAMPILLDLKIGVVDVLKDYMPSFEMPLIVPSFNDSEFILNKVDFS